jgi:acyl-CoA reductase-like NAD-dependent aldehyde dehydrogenase
VRDIREDSILVQHEQFSPILPVLLFDDVDDVVERANGTQFGLGGSVGPAILPTQKMSRKELIAEWSGSISI